MPHIIVGSSHCWPSWLQSLLSTQLKTNSSWPGETPGRHLFLWSGNGESRFVLLEVVVFLSCLGPGPRALSGPGWQSGERRLPGCQLELLAGAASGPAVHRRCCRCQGRLPSPCWRQSPPDRETCVRFSNKPAAHWRGRMDLHGNTGPPVFTINRWLTFAESDTEQKSGFLIVTQTWTLWIKRSTTVWVSPHFFSSACLLSHQVIFSAFMVTRWIYWNMWEVFGTQVFQSQWCRPSKYVTTKTENDVLSQIFPRLLFKLKSVVVISRLGARPSVHHVCLMLICLGQGA